MLSPRTSHLTRASTKTMAKAMPTSWKGGTGPDQVVRMASVDHMRIVVLPIRVARRTGDIREFYL